MVGEYDCLLWNDFDSMDKLKKDLILHFLIVKYGI